MRPNEESSWMEDAPVPHVGVGNLDNWLKQGTVHYSKGEGRERVLLTLPTLSGYLPLARHVTKQDSK